jgi:membrane protein implicated in regulation of membrane protease activity
MAMNRPSTLRSIDFAIVTISLAVIGTALGCLLFITADQAAAAADPRVRRYLLRLSWITLTLLLLLVVLFAWLVARRVSLRLQQRRRPAEPTPYLDAWALAGQRFKLSAEQEKELDELEIEPPRPGDQTEGDEKGDAEDDEEDDKAGPTWR